MNTRGRIPIAVFAALVVTGFLASQAGAQPPLGNLSPFGKPGSVLIFPYVNSAAGKTLVTITNTNGDHTYCGGGIPDIFGGTVRLKLVYVFQTEGPGEEPSCDQQDIVLTLTPNDTISFFADDFLEEDQEGWIIVAAISALDVNGETELIDFDFLIGSAQVYVSGENFVWAYDAFTFRANPFGDAAPFIGQDGCGHDLADRNQDDAIQFDRQEYDSFPILQIIPQLFKEGVSPLGDSFSNFLAVMSTELEQTINVRLLLFNNSEDRTSDEFDMRCFRAGSLVNEFRIAAAGSSFMDGDFDDTDDPDEILYSGWMLFFLNGQIGTVESPALLSVFAQSNNGQWYSGANNWSGPILVEAVTPRFTQFFFDFEP